MNPLHYFGLGIAYRELQSYVGNRSGYSTVNNPTIVSFDSVETFPSGEFVQDILKLSMGAVSGSTAPYRYVEGHEEYVLTQIGQELLIGGLMYYYKIPPSTYKLLFESMDAYEEFR